MIENDNEPDEMIEDDMAPDFNEEFPEDGDEAAEVETEEADDDTPAQVKDREAQTKAANAAFDELDDDELDDIEKAEAQEIDPEHVRLLEGVLFASSEPVSERALSARLPEGVALKPLLKELTGFYEGRGVVLVRRGGSWAFRTAPDLGQRLNLEVEVSKKLSRAAIETLAIIAYHQPVTRAEIEEIRGVSLSKGTLDLLFEETWIKPRGRRDTPGRPMQWGTSDNFLDHFGLASVSELPGLKELSAMGLLDSRPAIQAYSARAEMQSSEEVQKHMQFKESEIVRAHHHNEDDDVTVPALHNTPLEDAIQARMPEPEPEPEQEPEEELDRSGTTKATADKLDAAMAAVAGAVKSAVEALEREEKDDEDDLEELDGGEEDEK